MGRFHRHDDGTVHSHDPGEHEHDHYRGDHSGYATGSERIAVLEAVFAENDNRAAVNREAFDSNGIRALNLMSSPGSGKTTVLAATLDELAGEMAVGIIEGDIATDLDAAKLDGRGAQISLLNTGNGFGGECHLDAPMVHRALHGLDLPKLKLVIVENVGNLVCPAEFDVGEHAKAMVYSVTEGEDKPLKYPVMFRAVDVVLLNKIDLVPHLDADVETYIARVRQVNPAATVLPVSARTGEGMAAWFDWLRAFAAHRKTPTRRGRPDMADDRRHAVIGFSRPDQITGGFDRLTALADAGGLRIVDVEFIHSIRGVPSTVRASQIDPDLAAYDGANANLLSQTDLDSVADVIPVGSMAAVVVYAGASIDAAVDQWAGDGATVIRQGSGDSPTG